jgi:hypothetical protein
MCERQKNRCAAECGSPLVLAVPPCPHSPPSPQAPGPVVTHDDGKRYVAESQNLLVQCLLLGSPRYLLLYIPYTRDRDQSPGKCHLRSDLGSPRSRSPTVGPTSDRPQHGAQSSTILNHTAPSSPPAIARCLPARRCGDGTRPALLRSPLHRCLLPTAFCHLPSDAATHARCRRYNSNPKST